MSTGTESNILAEEYLPCPFCGDRDIRAHHRGHPTAGEWVVECHSCSCELTGFASQTDAWARWNKRPVVEGRPADPIGDKLRSLPVIGVINVDDPRDPRHKEWKL